MKQHSYNLHRGAMLLAVATLSSQTDAFTTLSPARKASSLCPILDSKPVMISQAPPLKLFNDDKDWTEAAGDFANSVGSQAWNLIKQGGSKLKDLAVEGAKSIKSAFLDHEPAKEVEKAQESSSPVMDTQDEELFRSIMKDEDPFPDPLAVSKEVDRVVDEAAHLIQVDVLATAILGDSIQHSLPISQSSRTLTVDGVTTTILEVGFEAWGTRGQGVASVVTVDGKLSSLELKVDGRSYPVYPSVVVNTAGIPKTSNTQDPQPWEPENIDTVLEVEVLHGVRRLNPPKGGRVIDAEILEKTILM